MYTESQGYAVKMIFQKKSKFLARKVLICSARPYLTVDISHFPHPCCKAFAKTLQLCVSSIAQNQILSMRLKLCSMAPNVEKVYTESQGYAVQMSL